MGKKKEKGGVLTNYDGAGIANGRPGGGGGRRQARQFGEDEGIKLLPQKTIISTRHRPGGGGNDNDDDDDDDDDDSCPVAIRGQHAFPIRVCVLSNAE
ncbi:hypothetical protein M0804_010612 [Polistes exclamans]|nr:hypothetical protein M0804_010612 [Polistes exclamans]